MSAILLSLLLVGVMIVAVLVTLSALRRAPEGYEDETGFHADLATPRPGPRGPTATGTGTASRGGKLPEGVVLAS